MSQPARTQGLSRLEIARGLVWANWDAVFFTLFFALTSGAFQIGLARYLGANDLWLGIITSVPSLAGALQIFTAYLADTTPSRKRLVLRYALYSRLPFVVIPLLPFLSPTFPRLELFATLLIVSAIFGSFAGPAFLAWLSDLVPPDHRGRYFGKRNMILGLVSAASALPPALFLDWAIEQARLSPAIPFGVLYGLGALFLFLSQWALTKVPEPPRTPVASQGLRGMWEFYREPWRTPNFRLLLGFNTFFVWGQMIAGQFFTVYMLEQLRMPYLLVQLMTLVAALVSSLAMPVWGYLADKFGNKPLLVLSMWGITFLPPLWMLTDPQRYGWSVAVVFVIQLLAGWFWAGVGLTQFNLNVAVAPPEQRAVYMGALSTIVALMGGIAAFVGGALMETIKPFVADPTRFFILFGCASLFRLLALPWLWAIREPQERSTRYVLSQLRASVRPRGWRALRQLHKHADVATRLQAVRTLMEEKTPLAVEELTAALHDPTPEVRREAAKALGVIGDARAVPALVQALHDPASDLVLEAAEALGAIGSSEATPELVKLLSAERIEVRIAAIQALRRIADPRALPHLLERLERAPGPLEQASLLEAITTTLERADSSVQLSATQFVRWLESEHADVRADAAAVLAQLPREPQIAPLLRARLQQEESPAVLAQLARALARHGEAQDVARLLPQMGRAESGLARQQIALSAAQLLGRYDTLYALLTADEARRDQLIERALAGLMRDQPELSDALRAYAYGDYGSALQILRHALPHHPRLQLLDHAPDCLETWLLAVSVL
ncbi:MAG: MFS transporter [Fimbriimonadales bacterium]|nr:MFS transporter [Fimbriimonadales bacterium]MDW8051722.1 MFS transporter [Armatimonadota bacterium]